VFGQKRRWPGTAWLLWGWAYSVRCGDKLTSTYDFRSGRGSHSLDPWQRNCRVGVENMLHPSFPPGSVLEVDVGGKLRSNRSYRDGCLEMTDMATLTWSLGWREERNSQHPWFLIPVALNLCLVAAKTYWPSFVTFDPAFDASAASLTLSSSHLQC
jgi:hypothetical protein